MGGFGNNGFHWSGNVLPAHEGNGAEGAGAVAAFGDFEVGVVMGRGEDAFANQLMLIVSAKAVEERGKLECAKPAVNIGDFVSQIVFVAVGEAAGDEDFFHATGFLFVHILQDGVDGLFFGGLNEAAGVDDDDIGIGVALMGGGDVVAVELTEEDFAVNEVFGAAEGDDADAVVAGFGFQRGLGDVYAKLRGRMRCRQ